MIEIEVYNIVRKFMSESSRYNPASHKDYIKVKDVVFTKTNDLVPERFSLTQRMEYLLELEKDSDMLTRYFFVCPICKERKPRPNGKASTICGECKKQNLAYCEKHDKVHNRTKQCFECSVENSRIKYTEENQDEWIECKLCGYRAGDLNIHILQQHNMTTDEYRLKTGMKIIKSKKACDRIKGDKNPGYQHGGKFSVFSDKFIYASDQSKENALKKAHESRVENNSYSTTIDYWLKFTDGNLEEARRLLSERQSTFSLEKCVEKFGQIEGLLRFEDRQTLWQNTLNSKSDEEKIEINRKKSSKFNYKLLWGNETKNLGLFYILDLGNNLYKIGVTTKTLEERYYSNIRKKYNVVFEFNSTISHCFHTEQMIKHSFKKYGIPPDGAVAGFGWTETFRLSSTEKLIEYTTKAKNEPEEIKNAFLLEYKI